MLKSFLYGSVICCGLFSMDNALAQAINSPAKALPLSGGTLTGGLTLADGSVWGATGLSASSTYTTVSTSAFNLAPILSFSSTANAITDISLAPTMTPTGATAGNVNAAQIFASASNSIVNISALRGLALSVNETSNYTGVIATAQALLIAAPNVAGTNQYTNYHGMEFGSVTNGNGITSGTVNNANIFHAAITASAGSGGTVNNYQENVAVPTGSGAGTTNNYGIYITGNGGTGGAGTTNNYAIDSVSTAPSVLLGSLSALSGTMPVYNISGTIQNSPHVVTGSSALVAGSATITLTNTAVYSSTSSYFCSGSDASGSALAVSMQNQSASSFKIFGTLTDTVTFSCAGT